MRHMRSVGEEEGGVTAQPKPSKPPILGLLAAQCLGAFNDNVYKMVVSLLAVNAAVNAVTHDSGQNGRTGETVLFHHPHNRFVQGRVLPGIGLVNEDQKHFNGSLDHGFASLRRSIT